MLLSERAAFDLAERLRSSQGVAIGEAFAFISGLYFRGKLAYALEFARPPEPDLPLTASGALVITPNAGLRAVETAVTVEALRRFATVDIAANDPQYSKPLIASARTLAEEIGPECDVVLLGSVASAKYVDILVQIFGDRLLFPSRLRRPRRHEPRRSAAAFGPRRRRTAIRAGEGRRAPRPAAAASAANQGHTDVVQATRAARGGRRELEAPLLV